MFPGPIELLGINWATWNLAFMVAVASGYPCLLASFALKGSRDRAIGVGVRYLIVVYGCALAAQIFAYAFDANTTLLPPSGVSKFRYYLDPIGGPKTLYGALLALPLVGSAVFRVSLFGDGMTTVDRLTPTLMLVLGIARVGCFLQGCCYGLRSETFGFAFPVGSGVHADQVLAGSIAINDAALPVLPVQLLSAGACLVLACMGYRMLARHQGSVYFRTVSYYSLFRLLVEFLRADSVRNSFAYLSTSQWIALAILTVSSATRRPHPTRRKNDSFSQG